MMTRINKRLFGGVFSFLLLAVGMLTACSQDDGNYDYLPDEEVSKIELETDTTKSKNPYL